ncbi:MAG: hypothetical protein F4100_11210 [Rhodothermaceae bacterium]|nr:hypothetical protein [Rhodothermaceae bacterium]MYE62699.1 hypothetical protein [Rhodothermaceae bacterium]MYJ21286.1 hypothetical protein [Rhodothermaceae bacterium]
MRRDPLFVQIKDGLNQQLDRDLFELCAADLLRTVHPTLVPVHGGNDSGFDGAIADNEGEAFPLIVTTGERGIENLTRNLKRYKKQGGPRKEAVFVTSRKLTPRRRKNLLKRARELGFTLWQVYDQEAIANLLYVSPHWCKELLGLSGSPSALSHVPKTARPLIPTQRLIGRDDEFEWLLNTEGDKLIVGQPGSGKTYILYQLATQDHGLFVVTEDQIAIANAIRERQPPAVFVDDAGGELRLIADLVHLRRTTGADFSIVAACWPGDKDHVAQQLVLGDAKSRHLRPLIRDQVVKVVKQAGLEGPNGLVRDIVDQAVGLPGLAITLARLCLEGSVNEVIRGDTLKRDLLRFIKSEQKEDAESILAGFSVGGEAGIEMSKVANVLGLRPLEMKKILTQLATGGVIADNPRMRSYQSSSNERPISVQPATLRYALVRDVFFGKTALLSEEILDELIDRANSSADVAETVMGAYVYGGNVSETLLQNLVEKSEEPETYKRYVSIGRRETLWTLQKHPDILLTVGEYALRSAPVEVIPLLLEAAVTAPRILYPGDSELLRLIKRWTFSGKPGTGEALKRRHIVLDAAIRWLNEGGDIDIAASASCIAVSPAYETTTFDPGAGNTFTTTNGLLAPYEIGQLKPLWDKFLSTIVCRYDFSWDPIFRVLNSWAYPRTLLPSLKEELHAKTRQAIAEVAVAVVEELARLAKDKSAVSQRLRDYINVTGAKADCEIDELMSLFCPDAEGQDWRASSKRRDRKLSELASKWCTRLPEQVVDKVTTIAQEASRAGIRTDPWIKSFYGKLSRLVENPVAWCWCLIHQNASADYVAPFLQRAVAGGKPGWPEVAFACLEKPEFQGLAVRLALEEPDLEPDLLSGALALVVHFPDHVEELCRRGLVPVSVLCQLLKHENRGVAIAAAKGEWSSEPDGRVRESISEAWRLAVIQYGTNEWFIEQTFKVDSDLAQSWLLARMQDDPSSYLLPHPHETDGTFIVAMRVQNASSRASLLSELAKLAAQQYHYIHTNQGWATLIVGNCQALQHQLLEDNRLKDCHLSPLRRYPSDENHIVLDTAWEQFALLAFEADYTAEQIFSATLPTLYSSSGSESALYAVWSDDFGKLLSHEEHVIRQVGELGYQWAIETRDKVAEEEHLDAVYGRR